MHVDNSVFENTVSLYPLSDNEQWEIEKYNYFSRYLFRTSNINN